MVEVLLRAIDGQRAGSEPIRTQDLVIRKSARMPGSRRQAPRGDSRGKGAPGGTPAVCLQCAGPDAPGRPFVFSASRGFDNNFVVRALRAEPRVSGCFFTPRRPGPSP
jgi:hypothetical protein